MSSEFLIAQRPKLVAGTMAWEKTAHIVMNTLISMDFMVLIDSLSNDEKLKLW